MRKASAIRKIGLFGIAASLALGLSGPMVVLAEEAIDTADQQESLVTVEETTADEMVVAAEPDEAAVASEAVEATEDAEPEKAAADASAEDAAGDEALPAKAAWDGASAIYVDTPAQVDIPYGSEGVWFKFIPNKTAEYLIFSTGTEGDPIAFLYSSYSDEYEYSGDDEGIGVNFQIKVTLNQGETYYIQASRLGNDAISYTLNIRESKPVTKVTAQVANGKRLAIGIDGEWKYKTVDGTSVKYFDFYMNSVKDCIQLTETYEDGTTGSPSSDKTYYPYFDSYYSGSSHEVIVRSYNTGEEVARVAIPVISYVQYMQDKAEPLSFDSVKTAGDETTFAFSPSGSGTYRFVLAVGADSATMILYDSNGEQIDSAYPSAANTSCSLDIKLGAGEHVYLYVWGKGTVSLSAVSVPVSGLSVTGVADKTYTGSAQTQNLVVKTGTATLRAGTDYVVSYKNNKNAGTATATITGRNGFTGSKSVTFKINKAANPMKAKGKTIKASANKKKTFKRSKAFSLKSAKGKLTFKKTKGSKLITVSKKTGKVTVKPGLAKGTYKVKVKITAKGNANYKAAKKTVTVKVKVQ